LRCQPQWYENLHKTHVKHLNCKLYYQQLHTQYLRNLAKYSLQAPWGWHDSVETCRSVIICEIIVYLLVTVQNKKSEMSVSHIDCHNASYDFQNNQCFLNIISGLVFQEGLGVKFIVVCDWILYSLEDTYCCFKLTCRIFWNRKIGVVSSFETFAPTKLEVITIQKSCIFILSAVNTWNFTEM